MTAFPSKHAPDIDSLRSKLASRSGKDYWRSLDELAQSEDFERFLTAEFPSEAVPGDNVDRRNFLRLMGASMALAGLGSCTRQPQETIVPYVQSPEQLVPGKPLFYATATFLDGYSVGVLVESHMGRPTKIEGNPKHPASLGATSAVAQASILQLYDPDRSQTVSRTGWPSTWGSFVEAITPELEVQKLQRGKGLRILTGNVTSPTLAAQIDRLRQVYPDAKWHQWQATAGRAALGTERYYGRNVGVHYDLERADVVVSIDADLFGRGPAAVRYAWDFGARRRAPKPGAELNRLYVIESEPTITGASADHRLAMRPSQIVHWTGALARELVGDGVQEHVVGLQPPGGRAAKWLKAIANDLRQHQGRCAVVAGEHQSPEVHALALAINDALGNVGRTVLVTEPIEAGVADHVASMRELTDDMKAGKVDVLMIADTNPVYSAPVDLEFGEAMAKVGTRVRLGLYEDETSSLCHWHIPAAHALETWGDGRAFDGTVTIAQPLIAPLYGGKSIYELMSVVLGEPGKTAYACVRDYWKQQWPAATFESRWRRSVHDGVVGGSSLPPLSLRAARKSRFPAGTAPAVVPAGLEVVFRPDPSIGDGEAANNGWLQELSKPLTKLTWDNAALLSPSTAARFNVASEDVIELTHGSRRVRAPAWIVPGQADGTITLHLGYGRKRAGNVGTGVGFDAYSLRTVTAQANAAGVDLRKTGERYRLASTQNHHSMEGRNLVRSGAASTYAEKPGFAQAMGHAPAKGLSLYPDHSYTGNSWGMVIDLSACIGCNACVAACQAENNIPVVGKTEVGRGREMAWLRVDRYYTGDLENPETVHQPVPCMHCERAPCEPVCPVGATVHSAEGLNDMVYNRCVGTRYCSNNCPYKVRRFNFFSYADTKTQSLKAQRNPDVTVRSRGVMEKCTYCVQRINAARIDAKKRGQPIADGEVKTACEAVCPTGAITFGNINDPKSRVAKLRTSPLHYRLLEELGTEPRTTYLAQVKNPNPDLKDEA